MTMTTSRRLELFKRTVKSIFENGGASQIKKVIVVDDRSDYADFAEMGRIFASYEVLPIFLPNLCDTRWRHTASLNIWLSFIECEKYVFHCEDDWVFDHPGFIEWGVEVLDRHDWVGQACLRKISDRTTQPTQELFWVRTESNCPKYEKPGHWPSRFTLTPTVTRVSSLKSSGQFEEVPGFEEAFGIKWTRAGWSSVYHQRGFCSHIGDAQSAYDINSSLR